MEDKTKLKLERRWLNKPSHHIDTSILIGSFLEDEEFKDECKNYLNKVGYRYRGHLSVSVTGELFMILKERISEQSEREFFFTFFDNLIKKRLIEYVSTNFEVYKKVAEVKDVCYDIDPLDALHLATAIVKGANVFITLDKDLINDGRLQSTFKIKIIHPKDF